MVNNKAKSCEDVYNEDLISESREVFLHSSLDCEDNGIDFRVASKFIKNIRILEKKSSAPIILHMLSTGGSWNDGMAIYDTILQSSCSFCIITYGIAASMASLIPQAAHQRGKRITMPNCEWMIHEGWTEVQGTYRQVISNTQWDIVIRKKCYELYTEACLQRGSFFEGKSRAQVKSYIKRKLESKEDWWLDAEEAVNIGLCDMIVGQKGVESVEKIVKNVPRILQL
tara:strand:- start:63329 stop:64009 length:681 start_codon:yes stop_codon:yes gene_type:complete